MTPSGTHFVSYMFRVREGATFYYDGMKKPPTHKVTRVDLSGATFLIYVKKKATSVSISQKVDNVEENVSTVQMI